MNIICHPEMNHTARENTHKDSQASLTTLNVKVIEKCLILLQKIKHYENTQGNTVVNM